MFEVFANYVIRKEQAVKNELHVRQATAEPCAAGDVERGLHAAVSAVDRQVQVEPVPQRSRAFVVNVPSALTENRIHEWCVAETEEQKDRMNLKISFKVLK